MTPSKGQSAAAARRRVLHVVPADGIGGVEAAARSMAERDDLACDFRLLFLSKGRIGQEGARTLVSPGVKPWSPASVFWALRTIRAFAPDVLVCSLWRSVPVALLAKALRPRTRLALFLHADRDVHRVDAMLTRAGAWASDEIWCDSVATRIKRLPSTAPRTDRRVISFVLRRRTAVPAVGQPGPRFVTWCRLTHQKAVDRAIEFIRLVGSREPDTTFEIWGPDGGELSALQRQVRELSLGGHVRFKGVASTDMLPDIAARNCFFLHPSRFEGMAIAVVEAMQMGLIPVVTPTGQMASYVQPGENGILIDPDRLDIAAAEVADIVADPVACEQLRAGALAQWRSAPLYADDVCAAARALIAA